MTQAPESSTDIIILTGHRKSGTSLLQSLVDNVRSVVVYPTDLTYLYAYFPHIANDASRSLKLDRIRTITYKTLAEFDGMNIYSGKKLCLDQYSKHLVRTINLERFHDPANIIVSIRNAWFEYFEISHKLQFCVKETSQSVNYLSFMNSPYNFKIVQIIRDPRDVYAALKAGVDQYYSHIGEDRKKTLASAINRLKIDMTFATSLKNSVRMPFLAIKFEDLVGRNSKKVIEGLANFLGLQHEPEVSSQPTRAGLPYNGNNYDGLKFYKISDVNVGRWHERISTEEAAIIEYWLNIEMKDWGYLKFFSTEESHQAFSKFYQFYNTSYFYNDPFLG